MSYIGVGDEDWVEFDLDLFERAKSTRLQNALIDNYDQVVATVGFEFEVENHGEDEVFIVVDGRRRFRAEVSRSDRLIFTGIPHPEGPL